MLSERLLRIAKMIDHTMRVADIGTDHAYLPIHLIKNHISPFVIASDINIGPLNNAKQAIKKEGLSHVIETRLGGGLTVYEPNEVDVYVIAGMGGHLMIDMINASSDILKSAKYCILQPMQNRPELRMWLHQNGYKIVTESIAVEGSKYYEILKVIAQKGQPLSWLESEIGVHTIVDRSYIDFLKFKIKNKENILYQIKKSADQTLTNKHKRQLLQLKEALQCALTQEKL